MPKLVALYIRSVVIGFIAACIFVALLLWQDVAGLHGLVMGSDLGLIAAVMLVMFNGIVFSGVQFALSVMALAEDDATGPRGGLRLPMTGELIPVKVPAKAPINSRKR